MRIKILGISLLIIGFVAALSFQLINSNSNEKFSKTNLPKLTITPLDKSGSAGNLADLRMEAQPPKFPAEVMVYKVKNPAITKEQVLDRARKLGISGELAETTIDFRVKSPNGDFIIDKDTGSFTYMTKEFETQAFSLKTLLSDEEYEKLATDFLVEKALMREGAIFRDINRDNIYTSGDDSVKGPYMIEARFGIKNLNGVEFGGVGPKIIVNFGENGKIIGAFSVWREVEPYKEYPIVTLNEAFSQIKSGKAQVFDANKDDVGTVTEAKLMYISDPVGYNQDFVIPHYMVVGINSAGKPFGALTRAIPENLLEVTPPPAVIAPQSTKN